MPANDKRFCPRCVQEDRYITKRGWCCSCNLEYEISESYKQLAKVEKEYRSGQIGKRTLQSLTPEKVEQMVNQCYQRVVK